MILLWSCRLLKKMTKAKQAIVNKHAAHAGLSCKEAEHKFVEVRQSMGNLKVNLVLYLLCVNFSCTVDVICHT